MKWFTWYFVIVYTFMISGSGGSEPSTKPNIVMIVADDLGWNDISMHGQNQFHTPNIDALCLNGITLQRHYVAPMCTPSRAALMTGRHGYHTGMFNYVIVSDEPWGMPLNELTLPEVLQNASYSTHLVGKWHLGFYKHEYTPIYRGFDTFNGYFGPYIDYWDHSLIMLDRTYARGYDMRNNSNVDPSTNGTYATDVFTDKAVEIINQHDKSKPMFLMVSHLAPHSANLNDPMQAPENETAKFNYIANPARRLLAAMISKLDDGVGKIVKSLKERCMLDNTIILFMADNGAPTTGALANFGSNHPLRGQKESPWEGGSRGDACIFSPILNARQRVSQQYIHITDWFKTFAELAGVDTATVKPNLDGYNIWDALSNNLPSPRDEIVLNIDNVDNYASIIKGQYKYIEGTTYAGAFDGWLGLLTAPFEQVTTFYADEIRNSEVGQALSGYVQLSATYDICPAGGPQNVLSNSTINRLRGEATIVCSAPLTNYLYLCTPLLAPCLFDIINDPCETKNLALIMPTKRIEMKNRLAQLRSTAVPALNQPKDKNCDPKNHNYTWTYWQG